MKSRIVLAIGLLMAFAAQGHENVMSRPTKALVDAKIAKELNLNIHSKSELAGVVVTTLSAQDAQRVSEYQHSRGKCAGYQALDESEEGLAQLEDRVSIDQAYMTLSRNRLLSLTPPAVRNATVQQAVDQVDPSQIRSFVAWFSSYPTRYNKSPNANVPITGLKQKIEQLMQGSSLQWRIEEVSHRSTPQKSLRLTLTGTRAPNEIVVLGGHADSINGFFGIGNAPGADDNASGSGALFEALRVLKETGNQPQRTIEFYWYAGEESGLLGSKEIAATYKNARKDVVAVLQLDMTAFPGSGRGKIGNVQDFTSAWLRDYFVQINGLYLNAQLVADECGYACSDHASWYQQGYPTLMPFEATTETMNDNIHTSNDVISLLDFDHAALFAKIAVIFATDLANSSQREPIQ